MPPYDDHPAPAGVPARINRKLVPPPAAEPIIPFTVDGLLNDLAPGLPVADRAVEYDFGPPALPIQRILLLKLDHFGDFIIALPALRDLRAAFPRAHIRMVCGAWNARNARDCGLIDEVCCFNYFPECALGWNGEPVEDLTVLDSAVRGEFDLAIDLRVDEDTRHLLARVNARIRCGIGSTTRFPLLTIALPAEHVRRASVLGATGSAVFLSPSNFHSNLPVQTALYHEGPISGVLGQPLVEGRLPFLPEGRLKATIGIAVHGFLPGIKGCSVFVEIVRDGGQVVHAEVFGRRTLRTLGRAPLVFTFENTGARSEFAFRVRAIGQPVAGRIRFTGLQIACDGATRPARFLPVELHVGETLSLLIALIRQRTRPLYEPPAIRRDWSSGRPGQIILAPFSNSTTRNWPAAYYARLTSLLLETTDFGISMVGSGEQREAAEGLDRYNASPRVRNLIGQTSWSELSELLQASDLVICNNSGIAHLAASLGCRVLAIYSGSHQPREWGPRGPRSHAIMHPVPCSPCGLERVEDCVHGHLCMEMITPEYVLSRVLELTGADRARGAPQAAALRVKTSAE